MICLRYISRSDSCSATALCCGGQTQAGLVSNMLLALMVDVDRDLAQYWAGLHQHIVKKEAKLDVSFAVLPVPCGAPEVSGFLVL